MTNYLFDIDGTLTYARQPMASDFKDFFTEWIGRQRGLGNNVFLVTGSDKTKTIEQIGTPLWCYVDGSFQNCGNQYYEKGKLRWESAWQMPVALRLDILELIEASSWYGTAGINIEERVGMINISTIGREASPKQRREYLVWDQTNKEREKIIGELRAKHKDLEFSIGGEISIDIHPKGADKSQVLGNMLGETVFFGDSCEQGGNDYAIAHGSDRFYSVKNPDFTRNVLDSML